MQSIQGFLQPMKHTADNGVTYLLSTKDEDIPLKELLGHSLTVTHTGQKSCIACGRKVKKLFQNGYCFPCVQTLAECDLCIVKPHQCHFHLGTCRDEEFARTHCMIPHYVYLAQSSGIKVGLTRKGRQMTRWVDQGAVQSILLAELPTRKQAGELEMEIARNLPDKTNWRKMLKGDLEDIDLLAIRDRVTTDLPDEWLPFIIKDEPVVHHFKYPLPEDFVPNLNSFSLDKSESFSSVLRGAKAQYLMFDEGVFHVKKHAGYFVEISVS